MWNGLSSGSRNFLLRVLGARRVREGGQGRPEAARRGSLDGPVSDAKEQWLRKPARASWQPLALRWRGRLLVTLTVVGGLRGLDHAPADSGSAGRHTDVRGSMYTHVGYPQEVAPD